MSEWQQHTQTLAAIVYILRMVHRGELPTDEQQFIPESIALIGFIIQQCDKYHVGLFEMFSDAPPRVREGIGDMTNDERIELIASVIAGSLNDISNGKALQIAQRIIDVLDYHAPREEPHD